MQLTDDQKQKVSDWIAAGAKLSEIQTRLEQEFNVRMTYMDVRLLVDDLRLTPQDAPEEKSVQTPSAGETEIPETLGAGEMEGGLIEEDLGEGAIGAKVSVSVDTLARPGAVVSGKVTFSDGQNAEWYLDQFGRLGMVPAQEGYRPPQSDVAEFQMALEKELMKRGF